MIIRIAKKEDLSRLNDIMQRSKAYWGYDAGFMKKFMKKFGLDLDYVEQENTYIASINTNVVGFYSFSLDAENQLELDNFFLHPEFIGQGFGQIMWEHCADTAKNYNASFFILWSDPNTEGFYHKMGCIKIGERQSPMMPNRYPSIFRYGLQ